MKLDYNYLKKILIIMEENSEHEIRSFDLFRKLLGTEDIDDKTLGHLRVLNDFGCIDSQADNLGIKECLNGQIMQGNTLYRLTSRGYEFLDILKNDTIFNKIKNFAISNAWDIGKQLLITLATR